jgi:hypothetical protein
MLTRIRYWGEASDVEDKLGRRRQASADDKAQLPQMAEDY